jgi:hypothetical protein
MRDARVDNGLGANDVDLVIDLLRLTVNRRCGVDNDGSASLTKMFEWVSARKDTYWMRRAEGGGGMRMYVFAFTFAIAPPISS